MEAAASRIGLNTNKQLLWKVFAMGTGASIGSIGHWSERRVLQSHSVQWFNNSSEGQAFNEAFNHMVSTAQNNHLDASDSRNLSVC